MHKLIVSLVLALTVGCTTIYQGDKGSVKPTESVAVVVGLTRVDYRMYLGWDGICAGADVDLNRMAAACREAGIQRVVTLYNERATTFAVLKQIMMAAKALEPAATAGRRPLLLIYVSGHGGETYDFYRTEKNSMNQTLCLWDGQLVDDLMWAALLKIPKGVRVVHITDTCNSGTNYRAMPMVVAKAYRNQLFRPRNRAGEPRQLACDLIHFGGCDDGGRAFGNRTWGGMFTYALIETAGYKGRSYSEWFEAAAKAMPKINQIPTMSVVGDKSVLELPALK